MKFRIVETKGMYTRVLFRPEYKTFLFWHRVARDEWINSISCKISFEWDGYFYSKEEATRCIQEFKTWVNQCETYSVIHEVDLEENEKE